MGVGCRDKNMAEYEEVVDLLSAIDGAINEAMSDPLVVDYVKETLQESIRENVYGKYEPKWYERYRRYADGGLASMDQMVVTNHTGGVLEIEDQAPGHAVDGVRADERIDDNIEQGGPWNVRFSERVPPPRPFYQPADEMLDEELLSEMICTGIEALI